ncbi:hypothetical protein FRC03_012786 [Tulasnella sp. 419]|nr:hypothetical protein FRC03_012786 [Tulasnella sp. 419]
MPLQDPPDRSRDNKRQRSLDTSMQIPGTIQPSGAMVNKRPRSRSQALDENSVVITEPGNPITSRPDLSQQLNGLGMPILNRGISAVLDVLSAIKSQDCEVMVEEIHDLCYQVIVQVKQLLEGGIAKNIIENTVEKPTRDLRSTVTDYQQESAETRCYPDFEEIITTGFLEAVVRLLHELLELTMLSDAEKPDRINKAIETISRDTGDTLEVVQRISAQNISIQQMISSSHAASRDEEAALNSIHPRADLAAYNSGSQSSSSFCLEDTRVALLNEIEHWAEDLNSPPIFWLCGMAGTGKSTIARTVAKRFDDRHFLGASFFFSRDEDNRRTTNLVFPTIAYQLARRNPSLRKHIIGAATLDVCTAMLRTQLDKLFVKPLQGARLQCSSLVIVMDALDECEKESQITEMLVLLASAIQVIQSSINIKLFLTSRPEVHISSEFKESGMQAVSNVSILHDIEQSLVRADISRYIDYRLQRIAKVILPQHVVWPTSQEKETLVNMAGGLFIFAAVTMAYVGDTKYRRPKQRLRSILLTSDQGKAPAALKQLDGLYQQILMASLPDSDEDEEFHELMQQTCEILGTIVLLLDPLSSRSLEQLLQWEEDTVEPALGPFHSIISISPHPLPVRVFHKSFPDFLTDQRRSGGFWFHVDPTQHHTRLALLCLTHMNNSLQRDMCGVGNLLLPQIEDVETILRTEVGEYVLYACRYWALHLKQAMWTAELDAALKRFCEHKLLYWLEILCLDGKLSSGVLSLDSARIWTPNHTISTALADCYRYLLYHQPIIAFGPSHIYQSTLPFVPRSVFMTLPWEKELDESPRVVMADIHDKWDRMLFTLPPLFDLIASVAYSHDGMLLASVSYSGSINICDARTGAQIHNLKASASTIEFSLDGKMIASASAYNMVTIWNSVTGILMHTLRGHSHRVIATSFSPLGNVVASGSYDNTVILWDIAAGSLIRVLSSHDCLGIVSVTFSPDGAQLVSGSRDSTIFIWDTESGTIIERLRDDESDTPLISVAFSPEGTQLASSTRREVTLWDYHSRTVTRKLNMTGDQEPLCITFSFDWRFFITGCDSGEIATWDIENGTLIDIFNAYSIEVMSIAISPDGSRIISSSSGSGAVVWDMGSSWASPSWGNDDSSEKVHTGPVRSVAFSPDGSKFASAADDTVVLWDIPHRTPIHTLESHQDKVTSVAFSTDGKYVASGSNDKSIIVWDVESGEPIKTIGFNGQVRGLAFSLDGLYLVVRYQSRGRGAKESKFNKWSEFKKWSAQDFEECQPSSLTEEEAREVLLGSPASGAPPSGTYLGIRKNSLWVAKKCEGTLVELLCYLPPRGVTASASFGRYFVFGTPRDGMYLLDFPPETFDITSTAMYTDHHIFEF